MKFAVGVALTVITTLVTGDVHNGEPGLETCKVTVLAPVVFQVKVCGPWPVGFPPTQPPQFQVKIGLGSETPVQVITIEALEVEGATQMLVSEGFKELVGTGFTVTISVITGEVQAGVPGLTSCKVIVLVPVVFHDKVWGPCPVGFPPVQPLQFHE